MHKARGFTLVEILVAFVMLALVGGVMLQLFQGGMRNLDASRAYTHAALLARTKLTELSTIPNLREGEFNGDFDADYRWQLRLSPYQDDANLTPSDLPVRGLNAELTVQWQPKGQYRVTTLLLTRGETP